MNYTKPEITSLASASLVIQGSSKTATTSKDSQEVYVTIPAYEADE
jgi:hypothetical protein